MGILCEGAAVVTGGAIASACGQSPAAGRASLSFLMFLLFICEAALVFCFLFSSRRRHTRFDCDWSSDVCSSDLGDASQQQTRTASHNWVSARLERGFDWAAYGDLSTTEFASGLSLAQYRRAVTGVAARVTTGPVTWSGFGSLTSQSLRQLQIRGAGISRPYHLASAVLPGTEYLRIETRDLQNPERAVATQALIRFVDYQIDYVGGVVLFKQPIPATDASGNPVFIVATFEAAAGDRKSVG